MNDFKPGQKIVCIHDDFKLYKEGNKPTSGPKKGEIVTFEFYTHNKAFLVLKEHIFNSDGDMTAWNSNKFAPLEEDNDKEADQFVEEITKELELDLI